MTTRPSPELPVAGSTQPDGAVRALVATDLRVKYRRNRTLGPFTFHVASAECVVLSGANGSGKTTAIFAALGLIKLASGRAEVFGVPVSTRTPPMTSALVPDDSVFWDWESALGNVRPFAGSDADCLAAVERVGLGGVAGEPVKGFSRGMRQRLAIARGLASKPRLLVLDEPSIALDGGGIDMLVDIIDEQTAAGESTLVATHDSAFQKRITARVVEVKNGRTRER